MEKSPIYRDIVLTPGMYGYEVQEENKLMDKNFEKEIKEYGVYESNKNFRDVVVHYNLGFLSYKDNNEYIDKDEELFIIINQKEQHKANTLSYPPIGDLNLYLPIGTQNEISRYTAGTSNVFTKRGNCIGDIDKFIHSFKVRIPSPPSPSDGAPPSPSDEGPSPSDGGKKKSRRKRRSKKSKKSKCIKNARKTNRRR
jgi:hypothetical protein